MFFLHSTHDVYPDPTIPADVASQAPHREFLAPETADLDAVHDILAHFSLTQDHADEDQARNDLARLGMTASSDHPVTGRLI